MTRSSGKGLRADANFTEDTVGFALESFLSLLSFPRFRFSIEPFSRGRERWLGADARMHGNVRGFRPFYMQFKRASAYPDFSTSRIVKERAELGLSISPQTLFFNLRAKQPAHTDYQHNVLYRLRNRLVKRGIGDATYVCPLFLDRSAYRLHLHIAGLVGWARFWRPDPWELEEVFLNRGSNTVRFDRIPVLAEHISVPPHDEVLDANHRYSFTERGDELCFHSPLSLPRGQSSLAQFLSNVAINLHAGGEKVLINNANEELRKLLVDEGELFPGVESMVENKDQLANWFAFGEKLKDQFDIEQFAMVIWDE